MNRRMPPRLRAAVILGIGGLVVLAIGGATHGWKTVVYVAPVPVVAVVALYIWSGRDSDMGAVIRRQVDERQAYQRLKVQALVGRVLSIAVAVGYTVASASKAVLWPWAVMLALVAVSVLIGWLVYGEYGHRRGEDNVA